MYSDADAQAIAADIDTFTDRLAEALDGHTFTSPDRALAVIMSAGYVAACEAMHDGASLGEFLRVMRTAWTRGADVLAGMPKPHAHECRVFEVFEEEPNDPREKWARTILAVDAEAAAHEWAQNHMENNDGVHDGQERECTVSDLQSGDRTRWTVTARVDMEWTAERTAERGRFDDDEPDQVARDHHDMEAAFADEAVRLDAEAWKTRHSGLVGLAAREAMPFESKGRK